MKGLRFNLENRKLIYLVFLILIVVTFATNYYGSVDIADYADVAKFFAGDHNAKIRSSHSYLLGFIHSPFVDILNNFIAFKITSILFLILIVYSVYLINNKSKRSLWLMFLSPIVWYLAPWISPIQLASLFLLWAYYFIDRYDKTHKVKYVLFSGIFVGLGWAVWDTILFFGVFLGIVFLFNKKLSHSIYFSLFILIGLSPRLLLDQFLFNFPFYTILKSFLGTLSNTIGGGIYGRAYGHATPTFFTIVALLLTIPVYFWKLYRPRYFKEVSKSMIFLSLSLLLILFNLQMRHLLILIPIIIILLGRRLTYSQFKKQMILSFIITIIFITPYVVQIGYSIGENVHGGDITYTIQGFPSLEISNEIPGDIIQQDLKKITEEFPDETFVIGNTPDSYRILAYYYWDSDVKEFVSVQDYELFLKEEETLFSKRFEPAPNINNRRQIWFEGGVNRNLQDKTDYNSIIYGIGINEPLEEEGFIVIEKYDFLYLSKKIN